MIKVIDYNKMPKVIGKVNTYKEAWELIDKLVLYYRVEEV